MKHVRVNKLIDPNITPHKTSDVAIVVTAYCAEPDLVRKIHMTKKLCQSFKDSPHVVVLASHSPMPIEIQELVDIYVYDKDNQFHWNGFPKGALKPYMKFDERTGALVAYSGIAELKSVHNAIHALQKYPNVKSILKVAYDESPKVDHHSIITKAKKTKKRAVLATLRERNTWNPKMLAENNIPRGSFGTHIFYSDIDFFQETLSMEEIHRYDTEVVPWLECIWYSSIADKNLLKDVYNAGEYYNYMGETIFQYNDSSISETDIYPF